MPKRSDYIQKTYNKEILRKMYEDEEYRQRMLEPPDHLQKMLKEQDSLRRMLEPPDHLQKMLKEQDSLRRMFEPPDYMQKMLEEQDSLRRMFEPPDYMQKMLEEQDFLRRMLEPPDYLQKMLEEQDSYIKMFAPKGIAFTAFQSVLNEGLEFTEKIKSIAGDISTPDFYMDSDGTLLFEDHRINAIDITAEVYCFFEDIAEDSSTEIIISRLMRLKKPAQRIAIWILNNIIVAFFVGVMVALSAPSLQNYFNSKALKSSREVARAIKSIPPQIDISQYSGYRVVSANTLNFRQKPSMKSRVVGKLKRGKLVRVVQKKKNWTKVEVESSDECALQVGWVATRHIMSLIR